MSQVQLNRSGVVGHVPATLLSGAMFYNSADAKLYIGDISNTPTLVSDNPLVIAAQIATLQAESRETTVSETAPTAALQGDLWFDLSTSQLKFYTTEWVQANTVPTPIQGILGEYPVTTDDFLRHIVYSTTDVAELNQMTIMIEAATNFAERYTGRMFISRSVTQFFDRFPPSTKSTKLPIILKGGISGSVTSIDYLDSLFASHTLPADKYRVLERNGRTQIYPALGKEWPVDVANEVDSLSVTYIVGTAAPAVPGAIKMAILLIAASMWENRENEIVGNNIKALKPVIAAKDLLHPYKLR